jgi:hypothetical protein
MMTGINVIIEKQKENNKENIVRGIIIHKRYMQSENLANYLSL